MWRAVFQAVPWLAFAVAYAAGVRPLRLGRRASALAAALLAAAFGKFAFFALAGGDGFTPNLPQSVVWGYGFAYGTAMFFAAFSAAAAVVDFASRLVFRKQFPLRAVRIRAAALAALAVAFAAWGMYEGVRIPRVRTVELEFASLPAKFDGYRIVHLSDLHCSTAALRPRFAAITEKVNALKPDLVAITGDFVDGTVADRRGDLEPIAGLSAKDGVVGCTGNHEAYWEWEAWRDTMTGWGVKFPEETGVVAVWRGKSAIAIGAIQDPAFLSPHARCRRPAAALGPDAAFRGAPEGAFRILLFHRPLTEKSGSGDPVYGVGLQLSGHTHGGAMPVLRTLVEMANEGRSSGVYGFGRGGILHLSPGTGQWAGFPMRFVAAEITELVLRRKN